MSNIGQEAGTGNGGNPEDGVERYSLAQVNDFRPSAETAAAYRQRLPEAATTELLCSADIDLLKGCLDDALLAGNEARYVELEERIVQAERFLSALRRLIARMQRDLPDLDINHSLQDDRNKIAQIEAKRRDLYEGWAEYNRGAMIVVDWLAKLKDVEDEAQAFLNNQTRKKAQFPDVERPTLGSLELSISAGEPDTGPGQPRKPSLWQRFSFPRIGADKWWRDRVRRSPVA